MQMEWLQDRVTVEQAEALHTSQGVPNARARKWWQFWLYRREWVPKRIHDKVWEGCDS